LLAAHEKENLTMGAASPITTAQIFGKYTLLEKLGEGYLGPVYRGFDENLGRAVVVRVLCNGIKWDAKVEELFHSQCQSIAALQHPSIAAVYEDCKEGQSHYVIMESLGGTSLQSLIAQKPPMAVETKLSIMIQVTEGLSYAHKQGILHRDLEPSKIHLAPNGNAKIRDFAVAHALMKYLPHPGIRWGVPIYLSPEQIQQKDCDSRSDIFSAGTVFYELITYHHPFYDRDSNKALDNVLMDVPIPTFDRFPDEPPGIWPILKTCLAKNPNDRYQSVDEVSAACKDLLKDLVEDTRMMLGELYAALPPLRKIALQANAPQSAGKLLKDIQQLLSGEKEADYTSLDRLMNVLIEQYPAIQSVSGSLPEPESAPRALSLEEMKAAVPEMPEPPPFGTAVETQDLSFIEQAVEMARSSDSLDFPEMPVDPPQPKPADQPVLQQSGGHPNAHPGEGWNLSPELEPLLQTPASDQDEAIPLPQALPEKAAPLAQAPVVESDLISPAPPVEPPPLPQAPPAENKEPQSKPAAPPVHAAKLPEPVSKGPGVPVIPPVKQETAKAPAMGAKPIASATEIKTPPNPIIDTNPPTVYKPVSATQYRKGHRRSYRSAVILLALLVIAAAGFIARKTPVVESLTDLWKSRMPNSTSFSKAFASLRGHKNPSSAPATSEDQGPSTVPEEAKPAADANPPETKNENVKPATSQPSKESVARITYLITSGKLPLAKTEIDKLQQAFPNSPQVTALRKQWQTKDSADKQEKVRKQEEQQKATRKQKEDEWNRQLSALFARGKYSDAGGILSQWLAEDPGSAGAQEYNAKLGEIQRQLKTYSSALSENKYQDALNALGAAEKLNPADTNLAELRRQVEAKKAAAKALLTVYRLGTKGTLLLDGRPVGNEGEVENEAIAIGNHTVSIESGGNQVASKRFEFSEGQRVSFVYDVAKQSLRSMVDSDRDLLSQRKSMEEVRSFDVEHEHGAFRGSCRGTLSVDYLDVSFRPTSGYHGFRMPFKLLKLSLSGKSVELSNVSDSKHFQSFKFRDAQAAERFKQSWDELKGLADGKR
jgi:serine/threonine protein kinase